MPERRDESSAHVDLDYVFKIIMGENDQIIPIFKLLENFDRRHGDQPSIEVF